MIPMPNFLIIGAGRAGSTALYHYMGQHPQVFMSPVKETNYFLTDGEPLRYRGPRDAASINRDSVTDPEAYRSLFAGSEGFPAVGEASPKYMRSADAARRIRRAIPHVRLIAILRNPVDRAYSDYLMCVRDGREKLGFRAALRAEDSRSRAGWSWGLYRTKGLYRRHLAPYFELFPESQLRIHLFEEFRQDPAGVVRDLFAFLGVDPSFEPDVSVRHNAGGRIGNPLLRAVWTKSGPLRDQIRPLLSREIRDRTSRFIAGRRLERPPLEPSLRRELTDGFREEILALGELLKRDLSHWL